MKKALLFLSVYPWWHNSTACFYLSIFLFIVIMGKYILFMIWFSYDTSTYHLGQWLYFTFSSFQQGKLLEENTNGYFMSACFNDDFAFQGMDFFSYILCRRISIQFYILGSKDPSEWPNYLYKFQIKFPDCSQSKIYLDLYILSVKGLL